MRYILPTFVADHEFSLDDKDPLHQDFIQLADGTTKLDDIIKKLLTMGHHISRITQTITMFHENNQLTEAGSSDLSVFETEEINQLEPQLKALTLLGFDKNNFFTTFSESALSHQRRLKEARILLIGDPYSILELAPRLAKIGIGNVDCVLEGSQSGSLSMDKHILPAPFRLLEQPLTTVIKSAGHDIVVYATSEFDAGRIAEVNKLCVDHKLNFLPYQRSFPFVKIGPFYLVKESACYECFTIRKNASSYSIYANETNHSSTDFNLWIGMDVLCLEIIKFYSHYLEVKTKNNVWSFNSLDCTSSFEAAFKFPRCPVCGINRTKPKTKLWE